MKTPRLRPLASLCGVFFLTAMCAFAIPTVEVPSAPTEVIVRDGTVATLSISASSSTDKLLLYQWKKKGVPPDADTVLPNGKGISGVDTNTLKISGVKAEHAGDYFVDVYEAGVLDGEVAASEVFTLTVNVRPKIKTQPLSATKNQGEGVAFAVDLTDETTTSGLQYRWQKNNVDINPVDNGTAVTDTLTIAEADDMGAVGVQWGDVAKYRLKITSTLTQTTIYSKTVTLKVNASPVILKQPAADTGGELYIAAKSSGKLSVIAGGSPKLSYQWEKEGADPADVAKATKNSLTLKGEASTEGRYRVRVTNANTELLNGGVPALSAYANVIVLNKPTVSTITPSLAGNSKGEYAAGINLTLSVTPGLDDTETLDYPLEYQWQKDKKNLIDGTVDGYFTGATTKDLALSPLHWKHRGVYTCIIKNKVGIIKSKTFTLKVNSPPVLVTPPVDTLGVEGGSVLFSLTAGGNTPMKYQWFKKGETEDTAVSKLSSSPKLTLKKLSAVVHDGDYYCKLSNAFGELTTELVSLQVDAPVKIGLQPAKLTEIQEDTPELRLTIQTIQGDGPITYQWQKNNRDLVDDVDAGITGARVVVTDPAELRLPVSLVIAPVDETLAGTYRCIVSNVGGKVVVKSATATVKAVLAPFIITEPEAMTDVIKFTNVTLKIKAGGTPALKYQWQKAPNVDAAFSDITGKKTATLALGKVDFAAQGYYRCIVSNSTGKTATSISAAVVVQPIPAAEITSFTPTLAEKGDKVRITGAYMNYVTKAKIGTVSAVFVKESDTSLLITVPDTAPLTPSAIQLTTDIVTSDSSELFTRSPVQANDRRYPKIITASTFPPTFGATTIGLMTNGDLPASGLGEAIYTWVAPKAGDYYVSASSTDNSFYIYLSAVAAKGSSKLAAGSTVVAGLITVTEDNSLVTFKVYGYDGVGQFLALNDYGPYLLTCDYLGNSGTQATNAGFNTAENVISGQSVEGQAGWMKEGNSASSEVVTMSENDQAVSFTGSSSEGTKPTVLWQDASVETTADSVVHAEWTMGIDEAGSGKSHGQFAWQVTAADGSPLSQLQFSVVDGGIYLVQADGTRTAAEPALLPGSTHRFEITTDLGASTWQARMDGVLLGDPLPLPSKTGFGDVSVIWYPANGEGAQPTMTFDNVSITVD